GDIFCGLTVPSARKIATKYQDLQMPDVSRLLESKIHEERLVALLILVLKFQEGEAKFQKEIFDFYVLHTKYINNWDLVDLSASRIVGNFLKNHERSVLYKFARSQSLWERRISIVATFYFIVVLKEYADTFAIADLLLQDSHDLIQKAVGWMLREVGKRVSEKALEEYLKNRYKKMPRISLRYAIERFPEEKRKMYLRGEI
ncbi:MAG TPA: DNA alkylation repair protein, partial [Candidatus Sulfotelmatobacter sp.]|nr:DNA alkylation repair protein [Candidatus Sulfotelmatobacter sp.]